MSESPKPIAKILAVDDQEKNLIALEAALDGLDLELVCVLSGKAALAEIEKQEFAAILLDVQMPVMDGFETAKRIRKIPGAATTPIIFVTAIHRSEEFAEQGYHEGAVDYLYKPLNISVLRAKVKVFCDLFEKTKEIERHAGERRELALLKMLLEARDEFISIASHELKTPLSPLTLNIQTIRDLYAEGRLDDVPREKIARMLDSAAFQAGRLSKLVSSLLDVSRIIERRLELERETLDLAELVRAVCPMFEAEAKKAGIEISLALDAGLTGRWDRSRIEQVFTNLMTNAMKYGGGKPIEVRAFADGDEVRLSVKDHGIGIAPGDRVRIFKRFERATSSKHYSGLGLGLYIAGRIVELHRGRIDVESEPGRGSTFTVRLPKEA